MTGVQREAVARQPIAPVIVELGGHEVHLYVGAVECRLGMFARLLELFAPRIADTVNSAAFRMFPESAAALGTKAEAPPTEEAVAFAKVMHGLHW